MKRWLGKLFIVLCVCLTIFLVPKLATSIQEFHASSETYKELRSECNEFAQERNQIQAEIICLQEEQVLLIQKNIEATKEHLRLAREERKELKEFGDLLLYEKERARLLSIEVRQFREAVKAMLDSTDTQ